MSVSVVPPPGEPAAGGPSAVETMVLTWLDEQITWFDAHASHARRWFLSIKVVQLVLGASVPVAAGLHAAPALTGSLGAAIVVLEGVQQLFQFHANWIRYRSTKNSLDIEKFLYSARAGSYAKVTDAAQCLANRIQRLVSAESAAWTKTVSSAASKP